MCRAKLITQLVALALLPLTLIPVAQAAPVGFRASGVVTLVNPSDCFLDPALCSAQVGDAFTMSYVLEMATPAYPSDSDASIYPAVLYAQMTIGGTSIVWDSDAYLASNSVFIRNAGVSSQDLYRVSASNRVETLFSTSLELELSGSAGPGIDPMQSRSLAQLPDPSQFASSVLRLYASEGGGFSPGSALGLVQGRIDSLVVTFGTIPTTVPLPAAGWLLLSGLGGLFGIASRRKMVR